MLGLFQIFKCKFCGTNYCKACGRGDFHGVMTDSAVCRVCFQVYFEAERRFSDPKPVDKIAKTLKHSMQQLPTCMPEHWAMPTEYKRTSRHIIDRDFASVLSASFAIQRLAFLCKDAKSKVKQETWRNVLRLTIIIYAVFEIVWFWADGDDWKDICITFKFAYKKN